MECSVSTQTAGVREVEGLPAALALERGLREWQGLALGLPLVEEQPAVPQYRIDLVLMLQGLARLREDARQPAEAARALEQAAIHGRSLLVESMNDLGRRETMKAVLTALRGARVSLGEPTSEIDDELMALDRPPPPAVKGRDDPQNP